MATVNCPGTPRDKLRPITSKGNTAPAFDASLFSPLLHPFKLSKMNRYRWEWEKLGVREKIETWSYI